MGAPSAPGKTYRHTRTSGLAGDLVSVFALLLAVLDRLVDILLHLPPRLAVLLELVQARNLLPTAGTHEVTLEQVRLHALLAERARAARRAHRVPEQFAVNRARKRAVRRGTFAHVGFGEDFGLARDVTLPGCTAERG